MKTTRLKLRRNILIRLFLNVVKKNKRKAVTVIPFVTLMRLKGNYFPGVIPQVSAMVLRI